MIKSATIVVQSVAYSEVGDLEDKAVAGYLVKDFL